jgi:cob(I)alamin adenosyltransferase
VPASNAFVGRVFSLSNAQWTKERNSLQAETVKALLQVIVNYDLTCTEMHKFILDNKKLLSGIMGGEKY